MQVEIVIADLTDAAGIAKVHNETWIATYVNSNITVEDILSLNLDGPERIDRLSKKLKRQDATTHTFVAKVDGVVVGFCTAEKDEKYGTIRSLYILPDFHRMGLGKKLLEAGLNWIGSDKDVYLAVAILNLNAQEFYVKHGFELIGKVSQFDIQPGGKIIPSRTMCLKAA